MKFALCFYGLFRSFKKTYQLTLKNFDLHNNDYDVFIWIHPHIQIKNIDSKKLSESQKRD